MTFMIPGGCCGPNMDQTICPETRVILCNSIIWEYINFICQEMNSYIIWLFSIYCICWFWRIPWGRRTSSFNSWNINSYWFSYCQYYDWRWGTYSQFYQSWWSIQSKNYQSNHHSWWYKFIFLCIVCRKLKILFHIQGCCSCSFYY